MTPFSKTISRAALCGALFASGTAFAQEKVLLRAHWEPGKLYKQQTETVTSSTLTPAPGEFIEQKLKVMQTTDIRVKADGANKRAEVKFVGVTGEMTFKGETFKFDSADPQSAHPLLRQAIGSTAGKSFAVVFDAEDKYAGLKDTEKLASDGTTITGLAAVADAQAVGELFVRSLEIGLAKETVAPGDQWKLEDPIVFPQAGKMKVTIDSKYSENVEREGRKHAKISFEGTIASAHATPEGKAGPSVSIAPDSKLSGYVFFDLERRVVALSVFMSDLTLRLQGNRIPMRQQVTTRLVSITDIP